MNEESLVAFCSKYSKEKSLFYIYFIPEVLDFTDKNFSFNITIFSSNNDKFSFDINSSLKNLPEIICILKNSVFKKDNTVVFWNVKNFYSWFRFVFKKEFCLDCKIWDLKLIESFNGLHNNIPVDFMEAINRFRKIFNSNNWDNTRYVFDKIYFPLANVVSKIENNVIIDSVLKRSVHAYYEILGQENGRLLSYAGYKNSFLPHTLSPDKKEILLKRSEEEIFLSFDFQAMEVFVLAWLTKDKNLLKIINSPGDIYTEIIKLISNSVTSRDICKKIFLPVVYGQSAASLSKSLDIDVALAEFYFIKLRNVFPDVFYWIDNQQKIAEKQGFLSDAFGKIRFFKDAFYKAKNFSIQSPAALICLEKLIKLSFVSDVVYNIHDGYVVYSEIKNIKKTINNCIDVLCSESEIAKGLKLKVSCYGGKKLNEMKLLRN